MRLLMNCFMLLFLWGLTGCGTVFRGTTETYRVTSDPVGAQAFFSTGEVCTTPCAVEKKRNKPFSVRLEKAGFLPFALEVGDQDREGAGAAGIANLLMFGSILWLSIDGLTGANKELTPNPSQVRLVPLAAPPGG